MDELKPQPNFPSQKTNNMRQHESMFEPKHEPKPKPISPAASQYPCHYEPIYEPPHEPKPQPKPQLSVHSLETNNTWQHEPKPRSPIPNLQTNSTWHYKSFHEPMYKPEPEPLTSHGSQYTLQWQQEFKYESMPKPEPQPIILVQKMDYTYGVTLSTYCTACYLKGQGHKCSDQSGHEWMRESVVSVSASALQLAIERKVYGMKEFQNYLEKYPGNNPRVQLQGNFCALFQHKDRHEYSGPEKDVADVITEALEDNENRSLSPCRLVQDMMGYRIRSVQTWWKKDDRGMIFVIQPRTEDY